jgi:hypothetical protein
MQESMTFLMSKDGGISGTLLSARSISYLLLNRPTITEMSQLKEYECFIDAGIYGQDKPPDGHKKIRAHLVFDVKHNGRHKARYIAGEHLTNIPNVSVYSGIVSL